ncbi:MAG: hypothetical protein ACREMM_11865 [Gemmatimonadales bacterium]
MSLKRLKEYLDGHDVKYVTISHSPAYTAQEVYVANVLAEAEEIVFNAGSFTELMKLRYHDYARLVHPKVLHFAAHV